MVTIGTWNLENLLRLGGDSGPEDSQEYESKFETLAATITDLASDVLADQAVGDSSALDDLVGWPTEYGARHWPNRTPAAFAPGFCTDRR